MEYSKEEYFSNLCLHWESLGYSNSKKMAQATIELLKSIDGLSQREISCVIEEAEFIVSNSTIFTNPTFLELKW